MDPNAALKEIHDLADITSTRSLRQDETTRLVQLIEALDDWIREGGFLPVVWQVAQEKARRARARTR